MTLVELIESLEADESIKFTQEMFAVRVTLKKGNENAEHREVSLMVGSKEIDLSQGDILSCVVRNAIEAIRR